MMHAGSFSASRQTTREFDYSLLSSRHVSKLVEQIFRPEPAFEHMRRHLPLQLLPRRGEHRHRIIHALRPKLQHGLFQRTVAWRVQSAASLPCRDLRKPLQRLRRAARSAVGGSQPLLSTTISLAS